MAEREGLEDLQRLGLFMELLKVSRCLLNDTLHFHIFDNDLFPNFMKLLGTISIRGDQLGSLQENSRPKFQNNISRPSESLFKTHPNESWAPGDLRKIPKMAEHEAVLPLGVPGPNGTRGPLLRLWVHYLLALAGRRLHRSRSSKSQPKPGILLLSP